MPRKPITTHSALSGTPFAGLEKAGGVAYDIVAGLLGRKKKASNAGKVKGAGARIEQHPGLRYKTKDLQPRGKNAPKLKPGDLSKAPKSLDEELSRGIAERNKRYREMGAN